MSHPTEARQLPGVKGQWILCSECPPTAVDVHPDGSGHVQATTPYLGWSYLHWSQVRADQYWRPLLWDESFAQDSRPFTVPPAPAPDQPEPPATIKRKIVQLVCHAKGTAIYAIADDGTAWISSEEIPEWIEMADLPTREVPNA